MKQTAITIINFYQIIISTLLKNLLGVSRFCRFPETCSEYSKRMITEKGFFKGSWYGLMRLSKCNPFYPAFFSENEQKITKFANKSAGSLK